MKQHSTKTPSILKFFAVLFLFLFVGVKTAQACHGVALVNMVTNNTGTSMTLDGESDASTCGCGPYYIQVEVTCQPTFAGSPPAYTDPSWNTAGQPYYHSILNVPNYTAANGWPDGCVTGELYNQLVVPFANLCPGTLYHWRYRENPETGTPSPWFTLPDFTTPGTPPASVLVATASPKYSGCPGDLIQLNASVTGGCPGATYAFQWSPATGLSNPNIANPVCTLSTNITYTVSTSGGCFTISTADDTVQLTIGPPPAAGIPTAFPTSLCSGQSSWVVLNGQSSGSIQWEVSTNGVNWFNIPGATDDSLNTGPLSNSLFFHAIVTGTGWPGTGCGSSTSPPVQVTVNQSPVADAGQNTSVCTGGCTNLTGSGGVTYTWQPGNLSGSTVNVCPPGNTTYTLYITDANGCSDSDVVAVSISNPSVTASPSVSICNGNSTILVASGPAGQTYSWLPSSTLTGANTANPTATPTATTTYTVTSTNAYGCTAVDSVVVQVTSAPPIVASNDTSLCNGGSATLSVTGSASQYTWSPGNQSGSSITVSPAVTTTYVVTGNTNNCISNDTVIVTVAPPFQVYAGPDFDVCAGTQVTLNVGTSGGTYSWTPASSIIGPSNTQSIIAAPAGNTSYTVNVTDANGCISADTINVTVNQPPTINASTADNTICVGQIASVTASGGSSYVWTPNVGVSNPTQATTNVMPTNTTTYMVTGTDANGCSNTDTITIFVNPQPSAVMGSLASECGDTTGQIVFQGALTGTEPFTWTMNNQPVTMPVTGLAPGTYTVTMTDQNGCTNLTAVTVYQQNTAYINGVANPTFGTYPLNVSFGASGSPGMNNYTWVYGDGSPNGSGSVTSNTYTTPGTYMVVVTGWNDDPSCAVMDTLYITVVEQATIALPNVFTPNEDATNDWFSATVSGVQEIRVQMYNRWGNMIYDGAQSGISPSPQDVPLWDGKNKGGKTESDGVYYYVVTAIGYDQKEYPMTGFVELITAKH